MKKFITRLAPLFILSGFLSEVPAATSAADYDYSHRKRECVVKIISSEGVPIPWLLIGIGQLSNDFTFGATIRGGAFDTLIDGYEEKFQRYFDVAIPENEMMWENVMNCSAKCAPDFLKADSLVSWLSERTIPICGRSLFSNEKESRIPEWTRTLGNAAFKLAMQERIDSTMNHFKGSVSQWELISEICHGANGSLLASNMLEAKSGDTTILGWIMDEARKRDSTADFIISDNGLITSNDSTAANQFINKVKPLSGKFDIVGAVGHFGAEMNKNSYEAKINFLAEKLGKPVCLTDVDFNFDVSQAPEKLEELMRTCFANPKVSGLTMGSWYQRRMSGSNLTNYLVDTLNNETPCGQRWVDVRREWRTEVQGNADDSGKFTFTGFCGKYLVLLSAEYDTFYLEPGEGTKYVEIKFNEGTAVNRAAASLKTIKFNINGIVAPVTLPAHYKSPLMLTTYSLSGQQLSRSPLNLTGGKHRIPPATSGCRVFRIETADRLPLYTGKISAVR